MIIVVSGLPRSGTSLMMQMLQAGGLPLLSDERRPPDESNPHGYWEYEPVRRLERDQSWLSLAESKGVKIVSPLLSSIPATFEYRVIFMQRDVTDVLRSQSTMLSRLGTPDNLDDARMRQHFDQHLEQMARWLAAQPHIQVLNCQFAELLAAPRLVAQSVVDFLRLPLDAAAMARAVQPDMARHHHPRCAPPEAASR